MALAIRIRKITSQQWLPLLKTRAFHKSSSRNPLGSLPTEARKRVTVVQCESGRAPSGICNVYLVATCSFSPLSCRDVKTIVSLLKPETVVLHLPRNLRVQILCNLPVTEVPTFTETMERLMASNFNALDVITPLIRERICKEFQIVQGSELLSAYEEATKYGGNVVSGDRPRDIIAQRGWECMNLSHKIKFTFGSLMLLYLPSHCFKRIFSKEIQRTEDMILNKEDMVKRLLPVFDKTFFDESDEYMCGELLKIARESKSVVAVVRGTHIPGLANVWKKAVGLEED